MTARIPYQSQVVDKDGFLTQPWLKYLNATIGSGGGGGGGGTIDGSGTANNVTMFTGPGTIGNAPGFTYFDSEGTIYFISGADFHVNQEVSIGGGVLVGGSIQASGTIESGINLRAASLSGTGNRIVTSNEVGTLENSAIIDGDYTLSGTLGVTGDVALFGALSANGVITFGNLAGVGIRLVTADPSGVLGTTTGGSGTVDGTGAANQVAYWTDTDTIAGSPFFTWNGVTLNINGDLFLNGTGTIGALGDITSFGNMVSRELHVSGVANTIRNQIQFQTALISRFNLGLNGATESGSNAGSNLFLQALTDAGAAIDTPLSIVRASGGLITLARPVSVTGTLSVTGSVTFSSTLAVTGTTIFSDNVTIAGAIDQATALQIGGSSGINVTTGLSQFGIAVDYIPTSGATSNYVAGWFRAKSAVVSYTLTDAYGLYVETPTKGAGSTISNVYGLRINNQSGGSVSNYAIYTGTGAVRFGDAVTMTNTLGVTGIITGANQIISNKVSSVFTGDAGVLISSTVPALAWTRTDGAVNEKTWGIWCAGTTWSLRLVNDANSAISAVINIARSGMSVTTMDILAANVAMSNVTTLNLTASGNFIVGGNTTINGSLTVEAHNGASEFDFLVIASRGSFASPSNVVNNDAPYNLSVKMYSGGTYFDTAQMVVAVDGTFTSGQRPPSRVDIYANLANNVPNKAMSIHAGWVDILGTAYVSGSIAVTGPSVIGSLTPNSSQALRVSLSGGLTGIAQYGIVSSMEYGITATSSVIGQYIYTGINFTTSFGAGLFIDTAVKSAGTTTNYYGIKIENQNVATNNFAIYTGTGGVRFGDVVGVGSNPISAIALYVANQSLTGNSQYGCQFESAFNSAATVSGTAIYASARLAASVATGTLYGIRIDSTSLGSGATATTVYGLKVENQATPGLDYAIFTGTGFNVFGDLVGIGTGGVTSSAQVFISGTAQTTGTIQRGIYINHTPTTGATNSIRGLEILPVVPAGLTVGTVQGIYIAPYTKGSGASIGDAIGLQIDTVNQGTNNYAIYTGTGQVRFGGLTGSVTTTVTVTTNGILGRTAAVAVSASGQMISTVDGENENAGYIIESNRPAIAFHELDAAANQGWWGIGAQANRFRLVAFNDAFSTVNDILTVDRAGAVPNLIRMVTNVSTLEKLTTAASTTTRSGLLITPGTAPTTPVNGDIWYDSATNNIQVRLNGVTRRLQDLPP